MTLYQELIFYQTYQFKKENFSCCSAQLNSFSLITLNLDVTLHTPHSDQLQKFGCFYIWPVPLCYQ